MPEVAAGQVFALEPTDIDIFTTTRRKARVLALAERGLVRFAGSEAGARRLLADLLESGALIGGHGGKQTMQFTFRIVPPGKKKRTFKPRFYVFGLVAVKAYLQSQNPQT